MKAKNLVKFMKRVHDSWGHSLWEQTICIRRITCMPKGANQQRVLYVGFYGGGDVLFSYEDYTMCVRELQELLPRRIAYIEDIAHVDEKAFDRYANFSDWNERG